MSRLCYLRHTLDIIKKAMLINNIAFFDLSKSLCFQSCNDAFNINLYYTKSEVEGSPRLLMVDSSPKFGTFTTIILRLLLKFRLL